MKKIRFYRMHLVSPCIFARSNNICQSIYLYLRGYRKHETVIGSVWYKGKKGVI